MKTDRIPDATTIDEPAESKGGIDINFKRVFSRMLQFWYVIPLFLTITFTIAYIVNRYSTRIYPVTASILIKENDENAGAKFLYNNELINPYRNFYNEIYIIRSYPLLQEVIMSLGFEVSFHREGDFKTTEYYDPNFPVKFHILPTGTRPYGKSFLFTIKNDKTFSLQHVTDDEESGKKIDDLLFNDTLKINGYRLLAQSRGDVKPFVGRTFIVGFSDPFSLAKSYSSKLSIDWAEPGASVLNLAVNGSSTQKEIDFLNKFIERYQHYDVEKKNKVASMAMNFLDEQLLLIGDSLHLFEDKVERFKKRNIITNLEEETNRLFLQLQDFENQKFQYRLLENYYVYISNLLKNEEYDGIFTPSSVGISDEIVAKLVTQLIEAQAEVNVYQGVEKRGATKFQETPGYQSKLREIQQLKDDILKTIDNGRKTQQINIKFVNDQIASVDERLAKLPSTERELIGIQRNYSLKENLYVLLLQKRTEAGLSKASTTSDIVVINPPIAGGAIAPKVTQNYALALGAGLFLPLLMFIALEVFNDKIQSKEDIEKITRVPLIGGVGHNVASDPLIVYSKPRSAMAESFRALRSNLNYFTSNKEHQIFLITSSIPGEGKSFTSLNLAAVFALAGKKTCIIGADLRKPKLFEELGLTNDQGLSQYLSDMVTVEEIIQPSHVPNLFLISGGPMPPNPSELLLKPSMKNLIDRLRNEFDFIIIDSPPLGFVTDAFVLAAYADHMLFVVRQNYTPKGMLHTLDDFYSVGKLTNVSILFNDLRKTGMGYGYNYGYGYSYGYGYGYSYGYDSKRKKDAHNDYYSNS